jgi:hypothetical protein
LRNLRHTGLLNDRAVLFTTALGHTPFTFVSFSATLIKILRGFPHSFAGRPKYKFLRVATERLVTLWSNRYVALQPKGKSSTRYFLPRVLRQVHLQSTGGRRGRRWKAILRRRQAIHRGGRSEIRNSHRRTILLRDHASPLRDFRHCLDTQLGDKHAAAQSEFTKRYLEERGQADLWNDMERYNRAVGQSSTLGQSPETALGRAYLTFRNRMVADLFDAWCAQGYDPKAVARAANRLFTDVAWGKGATPGLLMVALCEVLGCEVNEEAKHRLVAAICGFYDGFRQALKAIAVSE